MKTRPGGKKTHRLCDMAVGITRRDFIRSTAVGVVGISMAGPSLSCSSGTHAPRAGLGNLFMEKNKPVLVVVEGADFPTMLEAGFDALGGIEKLVANRRVVFKPNVVNTQPWPVTTDIDVILAAADHVRRAGGTSLAVCDANSSGVTTADKFKALNYPERLRDAGIELDAVDFSDRLAHVFVNKEQWRSHPTIGVVKTLYDADVIINLPVIKRHDSARFTCALKNHFGSVYFPLRQVAHTKLRADDNGKQFFDSALAEYADSVRSELTIVDGRSLLVRHGPGLKENAEIKSGVNRIILCGDMVATDTYCSRLMEEHDDTYSHDMISFQLETARKLGLGEGDLNNVVIKEITA